MLSDHRTQATALALRMLLATAALTLLAFVVRWLAGPVFTEGALFAYDTSHAQWLREQQTPVLTLVMRVISALHGTIGVLMLAASFAAWLQRRGHVAWAVRVLMTVSGGLLMNVAVKNVFSRARPTFGGVPASLHSFSFPSGHTVGATIFYGLVVTVVFALNSRIGFRVAAVALALVMVLWVAVSRFYLGAHFISDTAGGVVVGLLWLACCWSARPTQRNDAPSATSATSATSASLPTAASPSSSASGR